MSETSRYFQGLATGAVLGGVIGAGLAFFLSPHTGAQNRKIVIKKFNYIRDYLSDVSEETADTVMDIFGEVSDGTVRLYEDGRKLFQKQVKSFQDNWDDIDKEKYAEIVDNIGDALEKNKNNRLEDIEQLKRYWRRNWRKIEASRNKDRDSKAIKAPAKA